MTRFKDKGMALLLAASMALTASEAYAAPPRVCRLIGCTGGPDECLTVTMTIGAIETSMTCYAYIATTR